MPEISYVTKISKSGDRWYVNIPYELKPEIEAHLGKQVDVTIKTR